MKIVAIFLSAAVFFSASAAFADEEIEYKRFKFDNVTCDTAINCKETPKGAEIGTSAVATGRGANFRKWKVADIKLHIGDERMPPDSAGIFFVREESIFRIPAAVVFAALGTQVDFGGNGLARGITAAGAAIGLGLLVWQAKGDIAGQRAFFTLDKDTAKKAFGGSGFAEIRVENEDEHLQQVIRIGITKPILRADAERIYDNMNKDDLSKLMDEMGVKVSELEKEQAVCRYGVDPEYDNLQAEIEDLQARRGIAYKIWYNKKNGSKQ